MIVNPGLRRVMAGGVGGILRSAGFFSPLLNSTVPTRAAAGTTTSYTRATTGTVQNNDGNLVTALAGEARMVGARRVRNVIPTTTEDLSNASWVKQGLTVTGTNTLVEDTATAIHRIVVGGVPTQPAGTFCAACDLTAGTRRYVVLSVVSATSTIWATVDTQTWTILQTGAAASGTYVSSNLVLNTDGTYRFSVVGALSITGAAINLAGSNTGTPGSATPVYVGDGSTVIGNKFQLEDVTAQTTQTAGEYVSVGALDYRSDNNQLYLSLPGTAGHYASTPDSAAASVTGDFETQVQTAPTDWTPAATAVMYSKWATVGQLSYRWYIAAGGVFNIEFSKDGTNALTYTVTPSGITLVDGNDYYVRITRVSATGVVACQLSSDNVNWVSQTVVGAPSAGDLFNGTDPLWLGNNAGAAALNGKLFSVQIYNTIGGTTPVVDFNPQRDATTPTGTFTSSTTGEVWTINGASSVIRSAYYHGSFVDGVKCFPTDISGNPIPSSTLLGYQAQGARTNLCLQSNAFTTTWGAAGTPAATQNAIGPDGATSAWTLTDNDAGVSEGVFQSITLTAAAYTFSYFVKKTSGATSFPVIYTNTAGNVYAMATVDTNNGVATAWTSTALGTTASGVSARCSSYNASFWRVELTWTATATAWFFYVFPALTTNATQSTGVLDVAAQGSAVFYGAQVELGSFASSYIATTTIAVARNADVDATPTAGNILAAAGTVALTFTPNHTPSGTIALWGTYVDASNYTAILHDATNLIFRKRIAGVNTDATKALAFVSGTSYKICASWGAAGQTLYVAGVAGTAHANTTAAQIAATMQIGADGNSLQQPGAEIRDFRDWLRQLSASEQAAITA